MRAVFVIEDESHAEWAGEFATFEEALAELKRRASLPWDEAPNQAPCTSWRTCGRRSRSHAIEYAFEARPRGSVDMFRTSPSQFAGNQYGDKDLANAEGQTSETPAEGERL